MNINNNYIKEFNKYDIDNPVLQWCTSAEFKAFQRYTKNSYFNDINKALRMGYTNNPLANDDIEKLDKLFETIPNKLKNHKPLQVYRGTIITPELQSILEGKSNTDIFTEDAFMSTSKSKEVANIFAQGDNKIFFDITIPEHSNIIDDEMLPSGYRSFMPTEKEVLLPRNAQLKIIGYNPEERVVKAIYIGQKKPLELPKVYQYSGADVLGKQNKELLNLTNKDLLNKKPYKI